MKQLRAIRILLGVLFLLAATACLAIGPHIHPMARASKSLQIILSASSVTLGITLVWFVITFIFGRIYCASVCPIGVLSDVFFKVRRCIPRLNKPFSYRQHSKLSIHILWIYIVCLLVGVTVVPLILEPWNMAANIASAANMSATEKAWTSIGLGSATGIIAGILSAVLIAFTSLWRGREFCTRYCPVGTALGIVQQHSLVHIELDPDKCISCGLCEDRCRAQCIKISQRLIDQKRCVRCFDCVADCPEGAIRYQLNKNMRFSSPMMNKANNSAK